MYNGLAHTGIGAMVLTFVATVITAAGNVLRYFVSRGQG